MRALTTVVFGLALSLSTVAMAQSAPCPDGDYGAITTAEPCTPRNPRPAYPGSSADNGAVTPAYPGTRATAEEAAADALGEPEAAAAEVEYVEPAAVPAETPASPQWQARREFGMRGFSGASDFGGQAAGLGAYYRMSRHRLGLEFSVDRIVVEGNGDNRIAAVPVSASLFGYLRPEAALRLYGFVGAGVGVFQVGQVEAIGVSQGGVGIELDLGTSLVLSADARAVGTSEQQDFPSAFFGGAMGLSFKR